MDVYRIMKDERERLCLQEKRYKCAVKTFPDGKLVVSRNGKYQKYYYTKDGKQQYISKDQEQLIAELAKKRYLEAKLKDIEAERTAIDFYLKHHKESSCAENLLSKEDGITEILKQMIVPLDKQLKAWSEADYPAYQGFPQDLIHQGPFGKMYRSKTEANIAFLLTKHEIPQRYEWERLIQGTSYPIDFTIRHPKTGDFFFWEHFGKMDDPSYCMKIGTKLSDFESAGIFPNKNLIMTFESRKYPLNISQLEEIVQRWFL